MLALKKLCDSSIRNVSNANADMVVNAPLNPTMEKSRTSCVISFILYAINPTKNEPIIFTINVPRGRKR